MAEKKTSHALAAGRPLQSNALIPLHHRVYIVLHEKLVEGSFPPDEVMPTEAELSMLFGVSRITLRTAMKRLESEGLIRRVRGKGTFPLVAPMQVIKNASTVRRNQVSLALRTRVRLLSYETVPAPATLATVMELEAGTPMLRIIRARIDDTSPISYSVCHMPVELARFVPRRRIGTLPISATLEAAGVELEQFDERLTACSAGMETAGVLEVEIGSPLLSMTRIIRDKNDSLVEHLQVVYRPDRYEYNVIYSPRTLHEMGTKLKVRMRDRGEKK